jgi:hypothetical protein
MPKEKYTVSLIAKTKEFISNMKQATKAMKLVGDMNRGIIKNLQKMSSAATKAGGMFNQTQQKMRNGVTETERATKKGTKSWKKYFKVLAAGGLIVGGIGTALLLASKALKRARIGAAIQVQAKAFANLAASQGANAEKILMDLKRVSKGTVDNLQLMTTASRAIMLGIAPDKLAKLMEVARASAKAMGTTVAGAFSDIALGIGRQSRLILDNLGIIVRVKAAYDRYADSIGTTADALTDFEKQQAFANEVLRFGAGTLENRGKDFIDFQDRLAQVDTTMKNISDTVNLQLTTAFVAMFNVLEDRGVISNLINMMSVLLPQGIQFAIDAIGTLLAVTLGLAKKLKPQIVTMAKSMAHVAKSLAAAIQLMVTLGAAGAFIPGMKWLADKAGLTALSTGLDALNASITSIGTISEMAAQETSQTWKEVFEEIGIEAGKLSKIWRDNLQPDRSPVEIALRKLKGFNEEVEDGLTSSKNLLNSWTQIQNVIRAAERSIIRAKEANEKLPDGVKELNDQLKLAESKIGGIRDQVLLVDIGVPSNTEFNKTVRRAIEKMNRALATGELKTREGKSLVFEKLFGDVAGREGDLAPETKAQFLALQREFGKIKDIMEALPDTFGKGLDAWLDEYRDNQDRMAVMGKETAVAISGAFQNFFFDSVTGKLKSLRETFANFGQSILRSVSKALGDKATEEILILAGFKGNKAVDAQNENTIAVQQNTAALLSGKFGIGGGTKFTSLGTEKEALLKLSKDHPGFGVLKDSGVEAKTAKTMDQKATTVTNTILDKVKRSMTDVFTRFTGFMSTLFRSVSGLFSGGGGSGGGLGGVGSFVSRIGKGISGAFQGGGALSGVGGFLSNVLGGIGKILPFAEGGITSLAGGLSGAMMTKRPTLAAISETGKREAIVPLDKFADLIQQPNITINAIDTKSFQQYINDNKEILYGAINSVRSPQNTGTMASGPY